MCGFEMSMMGEWSWTVFWAVIIVIIIMICLFGGTLVIQGSQKLMTSIAEKPGCAALFIVIFCILFFFGNAIASLIGYM